MVVTARAVWLRRASSSSFFFFFSSSWTEKGLGMDSRRAVTGVCGQEGGVVSQLRRGRGCTSSSWRRHGENQCWTV